MKEPFGGRPFQLIDDTHVAAGQRPAPEEYSNWVRQKLATLEPEEPGIVRLRRPRATAAFSPQDTTHPRYDQARNLVRARGFSPVERGTGGRLTCFDEASLAVTVIAPHQNPNGFMMQRYEIFSGAIATALMSLGIDARVGELPDEYCPGKFSINAAGRVKLVGIAQRMNRRGFQMGAIIAVERSDAACAAIADAYHAMALAFDAQTYGAVRELNSGVAFENVVGAVGGALIDTLN